MMNIIIKDNQNNLYEVFGHLRDETELLICGNINEINRKMNRQIQIEDYVQGLDDYWEKRGYKMEPGLYDKLVIEYNQQNEEHLTRWK